MFMFCPTLFATRSKNCRSEFCFYVSFCLTKRKHMVNSRMDTKTFDSLLYYSMLRSKRLIHITSNSKC
jgi:hypothetical protein